MTDKKETLKRLNDNLNILKVREAKSAGNAPLALLNQIKDHETAISLTRQVITGELGEAEWRAALKPLLLAVTNEKVVEITFDQSGQIVQGDQYNVAGDLIQQIPPARPPQENPKDNGCSPELVLKLFKMDRVQAYVDEIKFEQISRVYDFNFGLMLENKTKSTVAQQINVEIEISWRGSGLKNASAPAFLVPKDAEGWKAVEDILINERMAELSFTGVDNFRAPFGQPKKWHNFSVRLMNSVSGHFLMHYKISSVTPNVTHCEGYLKLIF